MLQRASIQFKLPAAMVLVTVVASLAFTITLLHARQAAVQQEADEKILLAAQSAKAILGWDYHDRIFDKTSVSKEEFDRIVATYDEVCRQTGLQYIWSVMILDGKTVFTSATHSVLTDPNSDCATFLEPHSTPEVYEHAFATMQPHYTTFHNKWGEGRMVLVPAWDKHHRKLIYAASIHLGKLSGMLRQTVIHSIGISAGIALVAALLALMLARSLAAPIVRLTHASKQMACGDLDASLDAGGSREVAVLAESFDAMRNAIRRQMQTLHQEIHSRRQTEEQLRQRTIQLAKLESVVNRSPVVVFRWRMAPDWPLDFVTENVRQFGYSAQDLMSGTVRWADFAHPDDVAKVATALATYARDGVTDFSQEYRILTASGELRWIEQRIKAIVDPQGAITHYEGIAIDITSRKLAEQRLQESEHHFETLAERNRRLALEVEHRVRNNIAGLLGLLSLMRSQAKDITTFAAAIEGRLMAMAHVHSLLSESQWEQVDLRTLVTSTLQAMGWMKLYANPVELDGPAILLPTDSTMPLTLILVEWLNNSCKYGAHSVPQGRLRITWETHQNGRGRMLRLAWREHDGPPIVQPVTPSLGTQLVNSFATRELRGSCRMEFPADGASHVIEFPCG